MVFPNAISFIKITPLAAKLLHPDVGKIHHTSTSCKEAVNLPRLSVDLL